MGHTSAGRLFGSISTDRDTLAAYPATIDDLNAAVDVCMLRIPEYLLCGHGVSK